MEKEEISKNGQEVGVFSYLAFPDRAFGYKVGFSFFFLSCSTFQEHLLRLFITFQLIILKG